MVEVFGSVRERAYINIVFCSLPFQHVTCKKTLLYLLCVVLKINYYELNSNHNHNPNLTLN